jgi:putative nucleotidyltransferase with HDIG domain
MSGKNPDTTIAYQVELAIRQLDSLPILPCVAARFLSQLIQTQLSLSTLAETVESDLALTAKIFSLIHQQGLSLPVENTSVRKALGRLPVYVVRDAFFSLKVLQDFDRDRDRALPKKQLTLHALAVACCAKDIAEIISPQTDSQLAYSAGLLHDIGKLALAEAMPKSFDRIVEEAKSQRVSACTIEQKHLGLDHTTLGKRLAQKWHLPAPITLAIWLHHSDTEIITQNIPEAGIARIVRLSDSIARQCGIGQSGSYDSPEPIDKIVPSSVITSEQLEQIRRNLPGQVAQKASLLGLDLSDTAVNYCDFVHDAAAQLARDNTKMSLENRRLQTVSSHFDFITEFLRSVNSTTPPIDAAESFAVRWQNFYQTGPVCLYLVPVADSQTLEAVIVETLAQSRVVCLSAPRGTPPIPQAVQNSFAILDAQDCDDWLFEQLDVDFNMSHTKLMPLLSGGKAIGAIVCEFRYPAQLDQIKESFEAAASVAGAVLDMVCTWYKQQRFAEQFAQLLVKPRDTQPHITIETSKKDTKPSISTDDCLAALAEMTGCAAHELNNPLSVISGRAQLLAEAEDDPQKKRMLKQIQENTAEIAGIIDDLMTFASPPKPRPAQTDIKQILDEAIQLVGQRHNLEKFDIRMDVAEGLKSVFADSAQIVSALANIFSNALESYSSGAGRIKVTVAANESGDFVKLAISDSGCGMDAETLRKAAQPFFSARPAGRKRGMGLAHAHRLIHLNNGSLHLESELGSGTTATIQLPCK